MKAGCIRKVSIWTVSALAAAVLSGGVSLRAQVEGPQPNLVLVRAEAKGGVPVNLHATDLKIQVAGHEREITRLQPLTGHTSSVETEVAVLLDDGLRQNFGVNLQELDKFLAHTVSPSVAIGVGYMRNGRAYFPKGFTHDPEVVQSAVRLPLSSRGINGSPYFCLQDLVRNWPSKDRAVHIVLMITNGIDYYNGSVSPLNQNSPYVDQASRDAQKAGVPVYSIYFGPRGLNNNIASFSGQSYLGKVADETGGKLFNMGSINPPTLTPYFIQFEKALENTYAVQFLDGSRGLERLKVRSSVSGVKLYAQQNIQTYAK